MHQNRKLQIKPERAQTTGGGNNILGGLLNNFGIWKKVRGWVYKVIIIADDKSYSKRQLTCQLSTVSPNT